MLWVGAGFVSAGALGMMSITYRLLTKMNVPLAVIHSEHQITVHKSDLCWSCDQKVVDADDKLGLCRDCKSTLIPA